ncbi:MAG: replicative DNA helicase [Deltaproteobacteria bacterium RIFCSPHIGHO2_12_FULL_43_9]|nr:MAG: replicative DNA helicase [Deltaproteobacteria bacterium RIFCSPHIGHO2_12_FULL_43_9]
MALTERGQLPPQNLEAEQSVIGGILLENNALHKVVEILTEDDFYRENHRRVFAAILTLSERGEPADLVTLTNELKKQDLLDQVGGASAVAALLSATPTAANIIHYAKIVKEKSIRRQMISAATDIVSNGYEEAAEISEYLDSSESKIFQVTDQRMRPSFVHLKDVVKQSFKTIEHLYERKELVTGVPSGFLELDRLTSGFQSSDLVVVAGRPSMGKTSFALSIAQNAALQAKVPTLIFSLEMSKEQLGMRMLTSLSKIDATRLRIGKLNDADWPKLTRVAGMLSEAPIWIDDTPAATLMEMRGKCRRHKAEHDLGLVVVDYLQLMSGRTGSESREREISEISRGLKALAKEINVPVIALSQLNRGVEARMDKRPQLSDIRESGCISGDTLIMRTDIGELTPIKDLVGDTNIPILSLTDDWKLESKTISKVFPSGKKQLFELKTKSGRAIKASGNHPFFTINGWHRLDSLEIGTHVALPRQLTTSDPKNPLKTEELILLAHLIGDGCVLPNQPVHYTSADIKNINIVAECAKKLFNIAPRIVSQKNWYHVYLPSPHHLTHKKHNPVIGWFSNLGIKPVRSYDKVIPQSVFSMNNNNICLFLHHLWATDGNISWKFLKDRKPAASIYYATSSKILATQVQHLLLRLGIKSAVREIPQIKKNKTYRPLFNIHIEGSISSLQFCRLIGSHGSRGEIIPELISALEDIVPNTNVDILPKDTWKLHIDPIRINNGLTWRDFAKEINMSYCGSTLFKHGISRDRMLRIATALNSLKLMQLAQSDIYWDAIESITPLGIEEVFDATVPDNHNFVANDFIVHNSIEQDSDLVMFIYRDEIYNKETDAKGIAEIMISKQRNGPTGVVELAFLSQYTSFENLARNETTDPYST